MPEARNKRILQAIDLTKGIGLEIGPLTSPVVSKSAAKIYYLDHLSQDALKKKYKNEPVDPEKIQPVDFILKNNDLQKSVRGKKFDYVIASHVIEHIPDTVSWFKDVASILKPGGVLSLVIPDKRFTFDIERRVTEPAEIIGAYLEKLQKPTSASMYDFASRYAEGIDTASVWRDKDYYKKLPPKHRWTQQESLEMCRQNLSPSKYVDCHCYVFTPVSFLTILRELIKLDLLDLEVCSFLKTQPYELEFFISLKKPTTGGILTQQQLLKKLPRIHENDDQASKEALSNRVTSLEAEARALTDSLSWRITRPLRKINGIKKQLRR